MSKRRDEKPAAPPQSDDTMATRTWERLMRRALAKKPPGDDKPTKPRKPLRKRSGLSGA